MASLALATLKNRKLLKITGPDCYPYLQGLLCNDLRYLYEPQRIPKRKHAKASPNSLGAFMLNAQGKVMCDMILYRTPLTRYQCEFTPPGQAKEHDELLIECDSALASGLANTLYGYRVRRKISLHIENGLNVWCLFPDFRSKKPDFMASNQVQALNVVDLKETVENNMTVVNDPRLAMMGIRVLTNLSNFDSVKKILQSHVNVDISEASFKDYTKYRYRLGVGEGLKDHPEGNCLPLECNGDLLGTVSFDKGCYLGQELTARIHYTGVVRKRIMPITLDETTTRNDHGALPLVDNSDLIDENSRKKIGIMRHAVGDSALALLRSDLITESMSLIHEGSSTKICTWKPFWWNKGSEA